MKELDIWLYLALKIMMLRYQLSNYDFSDYYYVKVKFDSYDSLTIEKALTLRNVEKVIRSVLNKDQNHY